MINAAHLPGDLSDVRRRLAPGGQAVLDDQVKGSQHGHTVGLTVAFVGTDCMKLCLGGSFNLQSISQWYRVRIELTHPSIG